MSQEKIFSMLSLGDSYTIGEKVQDEERFPNQTMALLGKSGIKTYPVQIIATTGWTTDELINAIVKEKPGNNFDFVTLLIGVNNQYRGRDTENYRQEFQELLNMAVSFAGKKREHVYVLSIPDWGITPFAAGKDSKKIAGEIDHFNEINKNESIRSGVVYIDITDISRKAAADNTLIAEDGLHPSGKMYAQWARRLADLILKNQ